MQGDPPLCVAGMVQDVPPRRQRQHLQDLYRHGPTGARPTAEQRDTGNLFVTWVESTCNQLSTVGTEFPVYKYTIVIKLYAATFIFYLFIQCYTILIGYTPNTKM